MCRKNVITDGGDRIQVFQTSVEADDFVDEAGSYSKSRTRATLEVSAWDIKKDGANTKLEYVVKIHLNGSLPTSVVSMVATETPMCVGRVRDVYYTNGHLPYDAAWEEGAPSDKDSILRYSSTRTATEARRSRVRSAGRSGTRLRLRITIKIRFDNQKLYQPPC